ncbi:MAG: short-chain alcohol dehydrogenase [Pseudonocardiales bacterium]|nr:short-chain alcohol dehydrogenase [Pseudonocardiales bacterium]
MSARLNGKVAIVTGAGAGIGAAAATRFAAEGARVMCADVASARAEDTAARIRQHGGQALAVGVDVGDAAQVRTLVEQTVSEHGRIDVLYANAGVGGVGTAIDTDEEEWHRVMRINLTGLWLCCKYVLPHMVAAGSGSIVNQASIGGLRGVPAVAAYAAAKAGVIGLTRQMALDYGPSGVRVNAIAPGTVPTQLVQGIWAAGAGLVAADTLDEQVARAAALYPLRRVGTPDDVANVALFLASDEADWVTGAVYVVDGGKTAV